MYESSNKKMVQILVEQCYNVGIKNVVISPGSRNAPLIIAFDNHPKFTCYSIPDERSAAFYALGMAKQLNEPVALVCTSGTAVLNYAPAITEAYYQEVPIIAITADRPPELIDQEDGQTIRQRNIYQNHIRFSANLPINEDEDSLISGKKMIITALQASIGATKFPVHINIPFREPLYETESTKIPASPKSTKRQNSQINDDQKYQVLESWTNSNKVLVIIGITKPNEELNLLVEKLVNEKKVVVMAAPTANIADDFAFTNPEPLFLSIKETESEIFCPDLLLTLGNSLVSKASKEFLRTYSPKYHFDIDTNPRKIDTYNCLTDLVNVDSCDFIKFLLRDAGEKQPEYLNTWKSKQVQMENIFSQTINNTEWSDLKIYTTLFDHVDEEIDLHLGNSTPIRYAELFKKHPLINYYGNRGTSGIDGSTSTAAGAAIASGKTTLLITGDISFFYDSNALWNQHLPKNLKILLINNGGGNIFKIISGSSTSMQLEKYFNTQASGKAQKICEAHNVDYFSAKNNNEFLSMLSEMLKNDNCSVLEVFTNSDKSAAIFKNLISKLKNI